MAMARVTYIEADGREIMVEVAQAQSVMEAAIDNDIEGITAECGGSCACTTCHCYVESGGESLDPPSDHEASMLGSVAAERRDNSRLACQLKPQDDLTVRLPERQV
jgi:2Fe-2S ferredoxin